MQIVEDMLNFFISNAHAAEAAAPAQGGGMSLIFPLVIFFALLYFLMIRPQSKRAKEQRNLLSGLAKGDEVVTAGGILGKISKINDAYITLALTDTVEILVQKSSIVNALPKGTIKTLI